MTEATVMRTGAVHAIIAEVRENGVRTPEMDEALDTALLAMVERAFNQGVTWQKNEAA